MKIAIFLVAEILIKVIPEVVHLCPTYIDIIGVLRYLCDGNIGRYFGNRTMEKIRLRKFER